MTECDAIRAWLSAYLDGEITSRRREAVEAHLAGCDACRRELADLRQVSACLQVWQAPEANPELSARFAERLTARSRQQADGKNRLAGPWLRAAWSVGLAACLAIGVMLFRHEGATYRPPADSHPPVISTAGDRGNGNTVITKAENRGHSDTVTVKVGKSRREITPVVAKNDFITPRLRTHVNGELNLAKGKGPGDVADKIGKAGPEEPDIDPVMTAMNALTETPVVNGLAAPPDDVFVGANNAVPSSNVGDGVVVLDKDAGLMYEASFETSPEALAFAMIAETPR